VHNLSLYLSELGSVWAAQGLEEPRDYVEKMRRSPERAREFTRMMYEVHHYLGNEIARLLDLSGVHRLMDLGGNSGVVSMALLRKYPGLTVTVVDIENVCLAGREIAEENSMSDRISFYPSEFEQGEFPAGFDCVLKCDVSVFELALFRKLWASLNPGGRLVLVEHLSPEEHVLPDSRLRWTFLDSLEDANISIPTMDQVQARLVQAGFQLLPGVHVLTDDRLLFQALKPLEGLTN
jgi:SAM-dependent methyltransferase